LDEEEEEEDAPERAPAGEGPDGPTAAALATVQTELRGKTQELAAREGEAARLRAANQQHAEEATRLRAMLEEWSAQAARLEARVEAGPAIHCSPHQEMASHSSN
jgi:hypothetical protein